MIRKPELEERRTKRWRIRAEEILEALTDWREDMAVTMPVLCGVPNGARVLHLAPVFAANAIDFIVEHESFDLVPDGVKPPFVDTSGTMLEYVELDESDEQQKKRRKLHGEFGAAQLKQIEEGKDLVRRYESLIACATVAEDGSLLITPEHVRMVGLGGGLGGERLRAYTAARTHG